MPTIVDFTCIGSQIGNALERWWLLVASYVTLGELARRKKRAGVLHVEAAGLVVVIRLHARLQPDCNPWRRVPEGARAPPTLFVRTEEAVEPVLPPRARGERGLVRNDVDGARKRVRPVEQRPGAVHDFQTADRIRRHEANLGACPVRCLPRGVQALAIHQQMLRLNPNDNQGVRYLIGPECLRVGDDKGAIAAFKKCVHEEVGCAFGLALAKLRAHGPSAEIGEPLLIAALHGFLAQRDESQLPTYGLVGYRLRDTLSDGGGVSRAICQITPDGWLERIEELTDVVRANDGARGWSVRGAARRPRSAAGHRVPAEQTP